MERGEKKCREEKTQTNENNLQIEKQLTFAVLNHGVFHFSPQKCSYIKINNKIEDKMNWCDK